jgi:hypothetical protein
MSKTNTTPSWINENLEAADLAQAESGRFADALVKNFPRPVVPTKKCTRCDGYGEAQFCGPSRGYGVCYSCSGRGSVPSTKAGAALVASTFAQSEVARLRVLYRGLILARSFTVAAIADGERFAASRLRTIDIDIAYIVAQGKAAALVLAKAA